MNIFFPREIEYVNPLLDEYGHHSTNVLWRFSKFDETCNKLDFNLASKVNKEHHNLKKNVMIK